MATEQSYGGVVGNGARLRYFSSFHREIEQEHEIVGKEVGRLVATLPAETVRKGRALVDRTFDAFDDMFDEWHARIVDTSSDVPVENRTSAS